MDTEAVRENMSKFTPLHCAKVTWQVLEEKILFFAQRSDPDYFANGGPNRIPMAELTGLIDDVQSNKLLGSVTLLGRYNFNHYGKFGYNN